MRFFEILVLITLFISSVSLFMKPGNRSNGILYLPFLTLLLVLIHLVTEGIRWQLFPAYLLTILFLVSSIRIIRNRKNISAYRDRRWLRVTGAILSIVLILSSAVLAIILPVFNLPEPTGPYTVGTSTFMLEDLDREEIITENPDDYRRLMVRSWYPADDLNSEAKQMEYMHPYEAEYFAKKYGLPAFMLNHLRHIEPFVYEDLSVTNQESMFPVLIFSHGYNVPPATYAAFLTEIASHGYIIFAVNHTYQSVASVFPDGTRASFDYQYESKNFENVWQQIEELEKQFWASESDSAKRDIIRAISDLYPNAEMMRQWAEDLSFVVDELEDMNSQNGNRFFGKLNLDQIGAFGHSAGGGTAGQVMLSDSRIKAGINWDGAQWADVIDSTITQPFMRIEAVYDSTKFTPNDLIYHNGSKTVMYDVKVNGFGHSNFSDIPLLIPIRYINQAGEMDPYRAIELINDYSIAFFQKHLKSNENIDLRELSDRYPEVEMKIKE